MIPPKVDKTLRGTPLSGGQVIFHKSKRSAPSMRKIVAIAASGGLLILGCVGLQPAFPQTGGSHSEQSTKIKDRDNSRFDFQELADAATGAALSLPATLLGPPQSTARGTNWTSKDNRLKIATLVFRNKTLASLHEAIRVLPGRTITQDISDAKSFRIRGNDGSGSTFYVQAEDRSGEIRGLSITYEKSAGGEIASAAETIIRSYRGFPASTGEKAAEAVNTPRPSCQTKNGELGRLASGVHLQLAAPKQIDAGGRINFSWEASERFPITAPVYAILAISGEARFEIPSKPQAEEISGKELSEPDSPSLPGFIALRPTSVGPAGITFGAGMTRAFIPLHQEGSHLSGAFTVRLFEAGQFSLQTALIAATPCGETILESKAGHTIEVAPAAPEIVVQDPYSVVVPKRAILSNDGVHLLQIFEDSYQVYHLASGSKLVERPGHDPNFSPTGRFVAANMGAEGGSSFEVTDLLSRQQIASVSGVVIGWTESDAYLIAGQAGSWAKLSVLPTLISSGADNAGESFAISEASPEKNAPSWEFFGVTIGIDAGAVAFSKERMPGFPTSKEQTSAYELATGHEFAAAPPSKGWHARGPINFSHVYDPAADKINNREWAREQAKSKVLKELRTLKVSHRVLDQQELAEIRKPSNAKLALGDWRAKTLGRGWGDEDTARASFVGELGRFGVVIADEVPRQEFPPAISAVWRSKQSEPSGPDSDRIKTLANTLKGRLVGEIPASNEILKEGTLSSKSIDLERHLEGLWRWDVQGQPVWVLEGVDNQGSGGFAEIDSWLLQRNTSNPMSEHPPGCLRRL